MEDAFALVLWVVSAVLGSIFVWRLVTARREAHRLGPVRARVVHVMREPRKTRTASWLVTTDYDVPGHGVLVHLRWFVERPIAFAFAMVAAIGAYVLYRMVEE